MTDKTQKQMVQEIYTVLLGVPGTDDGGLVQEVKGVKTDVASLSKKHNKLANRFWWLVGILTASGVIGSGIYSLLSGG